MDGIKKHFGEKKDMNKNINDIFEEIILEIENIDTEQSHTNAVGIKIIAVEIIRKHKYNKSGII